MTSTSDANQDPPSEQTAPDGRRHVYFRTFSTEEIARAGIEGDLVIIPHSCCCVVKNGVYGKLIIV